MHGFGTVNGAATLRELDGNYILLVSLGLRIRNEQALNKVLDEIAEGRPALTQRQFDRRFGASRTQIAAIKRWANRYGLQTGWVSPDRLIVSLRGTAAAYASAFGTEMSRFANSNSSYIAPARPLVMPQGLPIQSVVGLDSREHGRLFTDRRTVVRSADGFLPRDFAHAYGLAGHRTDGSGQDIGLILWGAPVSPTDYRQFGKVTGVPNLVACQSRSTCSRPDTIHWVPVDGKSDDNSTAGEAAMDSEYAHAMAPHSRITFYLARSYSESALVDAIARAANNPAIHLVSNSWGGQEPPGAAGFEQAATNEFKHAAAVGTTFLFASGDSGYVPSALHPVFPTASPFVASVGGTTLQMNKRFLYRTSETVWNTIGGLIGMPVNGGGSGCAIGPLFQKQPWERGWTPATCPGRAYPDFAADADPLNSTGVYVLDGQELTTGGTSFAAPLWAGLLADTDSYLERLGHGPAGFVPMAVSRLIDRQNPDRAAADLFYDIRCGYNGYPAAPGWDEATGWGSPRWFALTRAFAGQSIPTEHAPKQCTPISGTKNLWLPWRQWFRGTEAGKAWGHPATAGWLNRKNPLSVVYHEAGRPWPTGLLVQSAPFHGTLGGPGGREFRLAETYSGPRTAVRAVHKAVALVSRQESPSSCSNYTPVCFQFQLSLGSDRFATFTISSVSNIVDQTLVVTPRTDFIAGDSLAIGAIRHDLKATNDRLPAPALP